jgi:hypothetical protein
MDADSLADPSPDDTEPLFVHVGIVLTVTEFLLEFSEYGNVKVVVPLFATLTFSQ